MPRRYTADRAIQPGDTGIWATCAMKKEAKSVNDLRDLFQEYATKLYGSAESNGPASDDDSDDEGGDIEAEIKKELAEIRKPTTKPLFTSLKLDTQCLMFFRTRSPLEPVSFVHKICQDIADGAQPRNLSYVKRLTPITATDKATPEGLEAVAKQVLAPHFHGADQAGKKFAIRPSIRNNKVFLRDNVIRTIAALVGPDHKVDLKGYDLLILVEIYKNVLGMSVVGRDFDTLKRYNIDELRQPRASARVEAKEEAKEAIANVEEA
ncbi:THUMP domain containing protein [Pyrenophora tritici-repentis]|nr:THUMP domain containing protein [Pyrenophora tritici-repentis]KAI2478604.1 THUMP domain containing protein [Pyrenophora tritici-repentis]